jgi:nicotinamide riboside kinase
VLKIALLGAESTGKTQLAQALADSLRARGHSIALVPEWLRTWCDQAGRTPRADEQRAIAQTQAAHIAQIPPHTDYLLADTTALMTAVYSELLFGDDTLYPYAWEQQRGFDLTLVTGLDLPWVADGLQRDGQHMREPVDACLRAALARGGIAYQVVYGRGSARSAHALNAIDSIAVSVDKSCASGLFSTQKPWTWNCEKCSDPVCEHRLFSGLLNG